MQRKEAVYKGLEFIPILYEDPSLTSPDYFQISEFPTKLTAGKNLFKLRGHPTNLRVGGALGIEVLDYNGNPIYSEVINFIEEDKSRVIAIYIYDDTSPGDCTVTLVAEASVVEGATPPAEYQGKVNVRWSRSVPVNPNVSNNSEIIFDKLPTVTIKEQVGVQLDRQYTNGQFPIYNTGKVKFFTQNEQPVVELEGGEFISDMKTGTITVASPVNPSPTPEYTVVTTPYVSTIKKILTPTTALLDKEYTVLSSQSIFPHTYNQFDASTYSLTYEATPTYIETENSKSYAYIEVNGLEPATGDVNRVKVYTNNNGTIGSYELVNDIELEETEIFIPSTSSLLPDVSIGIFTSQNIIDTYWEAHTYLASTEATAPATASISSSLDQAVLIDSSTDITANNHVLTFQTKDAYKGIFIETGSYKVTLDALGTRSSVSSNNDPVISIYMSGSAFNFDSTDLLNQDLPVKLGKRIGQLTVTSDSQRFDDKVIEFESDNSGHGTIIFVVESGVWQIADVRTTTDNDVGYTPNYNRIKTFIETTHKIDNQISFKLEYYNIDGVASKQVTFVDNLDWEGGNRYVDGDFSMLTGSLYVADSINSGVALTGNAGTGFVRSLGYQGFEAGFPGFLLFSGSALSGSAGTKGGVPYSGVGLELYAHTGSYFRYSTADSEIDVRTDKFFFGNPSSSFISGSDGIIEISSSNFVLSPEGSVTASNALFLGVAQANIVNNKTVTIDTSNSSSYFQEYTLLTSPSGGTTGLRVLLDGSGGGEIVTSIKINCQLQHPLGEFKLANYGSVGSNSVDFSVQNNTGSLHGSQEIYNIYLDKGAPTPSTYDAIEIEDGAVIKFTKVGSNIFPIAGTERPTPELFKRGVTIGEAGRSETSTINTNLDLSGSLDVNGNFQLSNIFKYSGGTTTLSRAQWGKSQILLIDPDVGATVTIELPAFSNAAADGGVWYIIKKVSGDGTVTIDPAFSYVIDGASSVSATANYSYIQVISAGNTTDDYSIVSNNGFS